MIVIEQEMAEIDEWLTGYFYFDEIPRKRI